jgi:hypothetical protein
MSICHKEIAMSDKSVEAADISAPVDRVVIRPALPLYFTMVQDLVTGSWFRVGKPYRSKEIAKGWLGFVRGSWRGHRVKLVGYKVKFGPDGKPTSRSQKKLDEVFNLDVCV